MFMILKAGCRNEPHFSPKDYFTLSLSLPVWLQYFAEILVSNSLPNHSGTWGPHTRESLLVSWWALCSPWRFAEQADISSPSLRIRTRLRPVGYKQEGQLTVHQKQLLCYQLQLRFGLRGTCWLVISMYVLLAYILRGSSAENSFGLPPP